MRLRPAHVGLPAMLAVVLSGCGSGGSGFPSDIPSQNADGMIAYLHSAQLACQNGDRFAVRSAAQGFASAVDRLPGSIDSRVRTVLRRGADNLTTLAHDPQQCNGGATGPTGLSGAQPNTSTTSTSTATTTSTPATKTRSTTAPTTSTPTSGQTTSTSGGSTTGTGSGGSGGVGPGGGVAAPGSRERGRSTG